MVGYFTTHNIVANNRRNCLNGGRDRASYINGFRTIANADQHTANDMKQPADTRRIRGQEARALGLYISEIDTHVDGSLVGDLRYGPDRTMVVAAEYSCSRVNPEPSILP